MPIVCDIPHPITIISSSGSALPLDDWLAQSLSSRLTIDDIATTLNRMADGVPTVIRDEDSKRYGPQTVAYFCTPAFVARCVVKAEMTTSIYLLVGLNGPGFIYRQLPNWQSVCVRPTYWQVLVSGRRSVFSGFRTGHERIQRCAQGYLASFEQDDAEGILSSAHQAYLESLRDHVALARRVEEDRTCNLPVVTFVSFTATDHERMVRDVYTFQLTGVNPFSSRDFVWVGMEGMDPEGRKARARVMKAEGARLTLKFERQVDVRRIPCPGVMGFAFNDVQQRVQERALDALRDGTALNPNLLDIVVDGEYTPFPLPDEAESSALNPSQSRALRCALAMEGMFLVLGPPGTGKTKIITAMAEKWADRGHKTLITSKNNLAVDNVLEQLGGLLVVRIGHEDVVSPGVRHLLIDEQARALQQQILETTDTPFRQMQDAMARWATAEATIGRLQELLPKWADCQRQWGQARHAVQAAQAGAWKQHEPRLTHRANEAQSAHLRAVQAVQRAERLTRQLEWALARRDWPMLGTVMIVLSGWLFQRAAQAVQKAESERAAFCTSAHRYEADVARYHTAARESPPVLSAKERLQENEAVLRSMAETACREAERIQAILTPWPVALPNPALATPEALSAYLGELMVSADVLKRRHHLLTDWRQLLTTRRQSIYPALIRSADVVGATCIGIATNASFRDLEFDAVVADEAGQIQAFDLLVPLVRARRAVLVGDHKQLPPMVDEDIRALVDDEDAESIALLEQSLFERLFEEAPGTHKAVLDTQYRTPSLIADFISQAFYRGQYHSAVASQPTRDPFFLSPFCFLDTGHGRRYRECKGKDEESGYTNPGEAEALAWLASAYMEQGYPVGVIVPYRLQVVEVRHALRRRRPDLDDNTLRDTVATVDSFQGKQRDTILFGFTRSNRWGGVGFLRELRRLNVTISRAQRQMVMVGDSSTLCKSKDEPFREFACALIEYIRQHGQYLPIQHLEEALGGVQH